MNMQHLSDEQFTELLAGSGDRWAEAHLEVCVACRQELEAVGSAVGDLNVASLRWAERRAVRIPTPLPWALSWRGLPGWGATLAGVLILGVALGEHIESSAPVDAGRPPVHVVAAAAPTEDELVQDNRLLRSIDSELSDQPQVPVGAQTGPAVHVRTVAEVSN
jgi:hypothetical protein